MPTAATPLAPVRVRPGPIVLLLTVLAAGCASLPDGVPATPADDPRAPVLTLPDGRSYPVDAQALRYTGIARLDWPDGRSYEGGWLDGVPHGAGVETGPDGGRYQGQWRDGVRHGHGVLIQADGSRYEGAWYDDQRFGAGTYVTADGTRYDGDWAYDRPDGFGTLQEPDGAGYTGEWAGGVRHGYGRLEEASGLVYEGTWRQDRRHGFGREQRPDGSEYEGEWQDDMRHGQGREIRPDGTFHDGGWELNYTLGPGLRRWTTGIEISGMWTANTVSTGLLALPTGPEYAGPLFTDAGRGASPRLLEWLGRMAERGDPYAQLLLGTLHLDLDRPAPDREAARRWLGRAAEAGLAEARYRLALVLMGQQPPRVVELLAQAAGQGHAEANRLLGDFYHRGHTVPVSHPRAARYYQSAVEAGSTEARNALAWLLATTPDDTLRDGERAVGLIRPIALHTGQWQHLDTLAAAWAAAGDFETASAVAEVAIDAHRFSDSAGVESERAALTARLQRYRAGLAYIDSEPL
jgi:TPR repeat protein